MTFRRTTLLAIHFLLFAISSCDRLERKGMELTDRAKSVATQKAQDLGDKVIARFDAEEPDSRFNKKRFEEMFGFAPTKDVRAIYGRSDNMGIDHTYFLAFQCQDSTIRRISTSIGLSPDTTWNKLMGVPAFAETNDPWWDSTFTRQHAPLSKELEQNHSYLWYDPNRGKAYFVTYDM